MLGRETSLASFKIDNMQYSNSQILAAVLNKFMQPIIITLAGAKLQEMPIIAGIENKIKSLGWVNSQWSLLNELTPFTEVVAVNIVGPMLTQYLNNIPEEAIPKLAHSIVDTALDKGELNLLDSFIVFDKEDLIKLKNLLNFNLPLPKEDEDYIVKE